MPATRSTRRTAPSPNPRMPNPRMDRAKRPRMGRAPMLGAGAVAMEGAPRIKRGSRAASSMRRGFHGRAARPGQSTRRIPYPAKPSPYRVAYVLTLPVSDQWKLMKMIYTHEDRRRRQQRTRLPPPTPTYGTRAIYTAFAGYSNNERVLCFLFVHGRTRRDNAPDNDRPPIGPPGTREGRQRS